MEFHANLVYKMKKEADTKTITLIQKKKENG
jgi:hypothetical protein